MQIPKYDYFIKKYALNYFTCFILAGKHMQNLCLCEKILSKQNINTLINYDCIAYKILVLVVLK